MRSPATEVATQVTARALLLRGMAAGLVAGLVAAVFAKVFGEAQVSQAIAFEGSQSGLGAEADGELVSRTVQSTVGLATAVVVFGAAIGGLFGLAVGVAAGRVGSLSARNTAALLALGGFVTVSLMPSLKYPANPPAVGDPSTVGERTQLYLYLVVVSLVVAVLAVNIGRAAARTLGHWHGTVVGAACYLLAMLAVTALLPDPSPTPVRFPADLLWDFRVAAVGTQAVLWATLGLLFSELIDRALRRSDGREQKRRSEAVAGP